MVCARVVIAEVCECCDCDDVAACGDVRVVLLSW